MIETSTDAPDHHPSARTRGAKARRASSASPMRDRLRTVTERVHRALHHHPALAPLGDGTLDPSRYRVALAVLHGFHAELEARRAALGHWAAFSLEAEVTALDADLGGASAPAWTEPPPAFGAEGLLGALYVAHGSGFGRGSLRAGIVAALPGLPHAYFRRTTDGAAWRDLLAALEQAGTCDRRAADVEEGAACAFASVVTLADRAARGPR